MATIKIYSKAALVGAALLLTLTGCPSVCTETTYSFAVTATFSPQKDSIQVGDTLFLTSTFPNKLTDRLSGKEINYANATNLGTSIFVDLLPGDKSALVDAVSSFDYVSKKGRIYTDPTVPSPTRVSQLQYQQIATNYELSIGFIARKKGVYCLTVSNGFSVGRINTDCDKASFDIELANTDQHLQYLSRYLNTSTVPDYNARGSYCFKVY